MNEVAIIEKEYDLEFIADNADNLPEEVIAAALEYGKRAAARVREVNMRLEGRLIERMKAENATKQVFKSTNGEESVATLKKGPVKCDAKDADMIYKKMGFDPLEIGTYEFKPSWTKAKEARKLGGDKQLVIDELFREGKESISF